MKQVMALCVLVLAGISWVELQAAENNGCETSLEDISAVEVFDGSAGVQVDKSGNMLCEDGDGAEEGDTTKNAEADDKAGEGNVVYQLTKGNLLDGSAGDPKPYDAKQLLTAKYYFLCFTTVEFPEYRDIIKIRVIHGYNLISKDFPGKVAFIFIPTDKVPTHLKQHLPELKIPFPILKRQVAEKSKLNAVRGNSNQCYAVVTADGKVLSANGSPLKSTSDPGRMLRDFMDLLEEESE